MKNACFISYSHSTNPYYANIVTTFAEQLGNQLALLMPKCEVYRDDDRLKPGFFPRPALAQAICESSCMVMLFTPGYFDEGHPFCALEYLAMQGLERKRAPHLAPNVGLIIPVVISGEDAMPDEVRQRKPVSLDRELLLVRDLHTRRVVEKVRGVAKQVFVLHKMLDTAANAVAYGCQGFEFPTEQVVTPFLRRVCAQQRSQLLPSRQ